jgi:predicted CDP-diglyceride synthetase/phosphatidate cytidylyltransferase
LSELVQLIGLVGGPAAVVGALSVWGLTKLVPNKGLIIILMVIGGVVTATSTAMALALVASPTDATGEMLPLMVGLAGFCLAGAIFAARAYRELPPDA